MLLDDLEFWETIIQWFKRLEVATRTSCFHGSDKFQREQKRRIIYGPKTINVSIRRQLSRIKGLHDCRDALLTYSPCHGKCNWIKRLSMGRLAPSILLMLMIWNSGGRVNGTCSLEEVVEDETKKVLLSLQLQRSTWRTRQERKASSDLPHRNSIYSWWDSSRRLEGHRLARFRLTLPQFPCYINASRKSWLFLLYLI